MSEQSESLRRAFESDGSFEPVDETMWAMTTTPFEGTITVDPTDPNGVAFDVTVSVPTLNAVTDEHVAEVVEEGWYETFDLRVRDVSGVTRIPRELSPSVSRDGSDVIVEFSLSDDNVKRGVADVGALVTFVEGTYVQGVIPGYDYIEPVSGILSNARQQGNGGAF